MNSKPADFKNDAFTSKSGAQPADFLFPRLCVDTKKLTENARVVTTLCREHGVDVVGVTKGTCGNRAVAQAWVDGGVAALADSRVQNLAHYADIAVPKWLVRTPAISEAAAVVQFADVSLNAEIDTLQALSAAATALQDAHSHGVVLMYDLGDLREGYVDVEELLRAAELAHALPSLHLEGVGTNLACLNFVASDAEKLEELARVADIIKEQFGIDALTVSGGNSATLKQMMTEGLPAQVNNLRLGESMLVGKERAAYTYLDSTWDDAFILEAEVIEIKEKPSMPFGTIQADSFGNVPTFVDHGTRKRALLNVGKQDSDPGHLVPLDAGVEIDAMSCDHLVCDVTDVPHEIRCGDILRFKAGYYAIMRAFTSDYVNICVQ